MTTNSTSKGIIVGCDGKQEFLLPFFYLNLRLHSDLPITFFDFGMSAFGQNFCKKRGQILPIEKSLYQTTSSDFKAVKRLSWFKKPLACDLSPYDISLWIDLDMLIRAPFDHILDLISGDTHLAITHEYNVEVPDIKEIEKIPIYNSGFFAFKKGSFLIKRWVELCGRLEKNRIGDQDILSYELYNHPHRFIILDPAYNRLVGTHEENLEHLIDIETPLFINDRLDRHPKTLKDAKNIHFVADTKGLLLSRFFYLEKMCQIQDELKEPFHV